MIERVKHLVDFFKENPRFVPGCGIFSTRNWAGDTMNTIYSEPADGVTVDICYEYDYIEILGLTDDEFSEACKEISGVYESPFDDESYDLSLEDAQEQWDAMAEQHPDDENYDCEI